MVVRTYLIEISDLREKKDENQKFLHEADEYLFFHVGRQNKDYEKISQQFLFAVVVVDDVGDDVKKAGLIPETRKKKSYIDLYVCET